MRTISVRLPDETLDRLTKKTRTMRVTKSFLVRQGLEKVLGEQANIGMISCFDLARDLAGSVKGLPHDLARSPKHMDCFGE